MNSISPSQSSLFSLPALQQYDEYLLVMNPDESVSNDVAYNRKKVIEMIGDKVKNNVPPYISIASFFYAIETEGALIRSITQCLKGRIRSSFIWLEDFGCIESKGDLFILSKPKSFFNEICKVVYPALVHCQGLDKSKTVAFNKDPHIPIAKGLSAAQLAKAWSFFKQKKYENKFIADKLSLLKRGDLDAEFALVAEFKL